MSSQRVALITGGAAGLGAASALALARRGCTIVIADREGEGAERSAARCRHTSPGSFAIRVDLRDPDGPRSMVDATVGRAGQIDILFNCAAAAPAEAFLDMTAEAWDTALAVNVRAVAVAMACAGREMAKRKSGRIINVTSAAARMSPPNYVAYAATKAAVDVLTRTGAVALAKHGILVNSLSPGMMDTALQIDTEAIFCALEGRTDLDGFKAERTARIPLGRRSDPEEMAEAVAWLALDAPAYMTAARLNVSGGLDKD
jgi:NAD(P)-dependent dehydrogenase (short-subunit alcohol dehydrogenase family)